MSLWIKSFKPLACVQTSPISFHPWKRDVCETASLIMFQYPAVFQEFMESAFIGCLTIATVRNNSDWLSSGNARDNVCDLHLAGFSIDQNMSDCLLCFSTILKNNDRNLVKSHSGFKVQEDISFLFSSSYTKHRHIFVDRAWESCESGEVFTPT